MGGRGPLGERLELEELLRTVVAWLADLVGEREPKKPGGVRGGGRADEPGPRGGVGGSLLTGLILAAGGGVPGGIADGERLLLGDGREGAGDCRSGDGDGIPDGVRLLASDGDPGDDGAATGEGGLMPQRKRMSLYITDAAASAAFISSFSQSKWRLSHCGV